MFPIKASPIPTLAIAWRSFVMPSFEIWSLIQYQYTQGLVLAGGLLKLMDSVSEVCP
jgi:hypothetical protein